MKMKKKKRRVKIRRRWIVPPVTKIKKSGKIYRRVRAKRKTREEAKDIS